MNTAATMGTTDTLTRVKTGSVTKLKLAVATLAAVLAGGAAFGFSPPPRGSTYYNTVSSCRAIAGGVATEVQYTNRCTAGKNYTYVCLNDNTYRLIWRSPCAGTPTSASPSPVDTFVNGTCRQLPNGIVVTENYLTKCSGTNKYTYSCYSPTRLKTTNTACTATAPYCLDTDGGLNFTTRATVGMSNPRTGAFISAGIDTCVGNMAKEGSCIGGSPRFSTTSCPSNFTCGTTPSTAGRCVYNSPNRCVDLDSGVDQYTASSARLISLSNGTVVSEQADSCLADSALSGYVKEAFCDGNNIAFVTSTCAAGEACNAGKCAPLPQGTLDVLLQPNTGLYQAHAVGSFFNNSIIYSEITIGLLARNEPVRINRVLIKINASPGDQVANDYQSIQLYNGSTVPLGSVTPTVVDIPGVGPSVVADFNNLNFVVYTTTSTATNTASLPVRFVFNSLGDSALESGTSPLMSFGTGGNAQDSVFIEAEGVNSGVRLGNDQINGAASSSFKGVGRMHYLLYKSIPTLSLGSGFSPILTNNSENILSKFRIYASSRGPIALKQLAFKLDLIDSGTFDPISASWFKLYRNSTDISDLVYFNRIDPGTGAVVRLSSEASAPTSSRFITAGDNQTLYVVWRDSGEEVVPSGSSVDYHLKATLFGFNHSADNDLIRTKLLVDNVELTQVDGLEPRYLDVWSGGTCEDDRIGIIGLQSLNGISSGLSPVTSAATFVWSDMNAEPHSAAMSSCSGVLSSGDWFNSIGITGPVYQTIVN